VKRSRLGRRDVEVFSLSFLDAICCGFGAVILLLVLTEVGEPVVFEKSREELEGRVLELQEQLVEIRGTSEVLNRELKARRVQLSEEQQKIARLRGDLSSLRGQFESSRKDAEVANEIEGRLVSAQQELSEEMKRLLGAQFRRKEQSAIGGIPVDSEYIIFIIDTSGSMANYAWPLMLAKMQEVLDAHPTVKGWQVMNDEGGYMFSGYRGRWLPDTPAQRKIVLDRLRSWFPFSNSSPVEGIVEAIRSYHSSGRRISLYVLGDEFTGSSVDSVVRAVDLINREDRTGARRVRIHALAFPVRPDAPQFTSVRFATLMRVLCARNGGTFVGLNEPASYRR
jgi:ribosomal protein L29